MPYIYVSGCDTEKNIQQINIRAEVMFSKEYFQDQVRTQNKLKQLKEVLEAVIAVYFDDLNIQESEILSNHENNLKFNFTKL